MNGQKQWKTEPRSHYAWRILLVCCCLSGTVSGMVVHCRGVFYIPAAAELGVSPTTYSTYLTCGGLMGVAVMPWITRWFRTKPVKRIMLAYLAIFFGCVAALGMATSMWQCYGIGACQGSVSAFLTLYPVSTLIQNWFTKKRGLLIGLASTFAGLLASVMNVAAERMIAAWGWRTAYLVIAAAGFLISAVPVGLFLVRDPAEMGLEPYGGAVCAAAGPEPQSLPAKKVGLPVLLPFLLITVGCYASGGYVQHMSNYAVELGYTTAMGATLVSTGMLGNVSGKLLGGLLNDWLGIRKTACLTLSSIAVGFGILTACPKTAPLLYLAAMLCGQTTAFIAVQIPLLLGAAFRDRREYETVFACVMRVGSLTSAVNQTLIGCLYGLCGSYRLGHAISAGLLLVGAAMVVLAGNTRRRA